MSGLLDRKLQVKRAIRMQGPDYVPILFFNKDKEQSDITIVDVVGHFMGENNNRSEWGFIWKKRDETMGQPEEELIKSWDNLERLSFPDAYRADRFAGVHEAMEMYGRRYYLASLVLTGFTIMTFLRGFSNLLGDLYIHRQEVENLAGLVFGFEENIIRQLKDYGFDGVAFYDDWGTQDNLIISPSMWRDFFKPRYKRQFDLAHLNQLDVYFHSCGYIYEIIPDLIEIGVDMLNLSQPNIFNIEQIGREFGGKVCFVCPVSYQTTSISGTEDEIFQEVKTLVDNLGCYDGGLIGYVEEYGSIGMSELNYRSCIRAFKELGRYEGTL